MKVHAVQCSAVLGSVSRFSNMPDSLVLNSEQFPLYIWEKVMTVSDTGVRCTACIVYSIVCTSSTHYSVHF